MLKINKPVCWTTQGLTYHPNHLEFRHFQPFVAHFGPLVGYFEPFQHWVALKLVQHCLMVRLMVARLVMVDFLQEFVLRDVLFKYVSTNKQNTRVSIINSFI